MNWKDWNARIEQYDSYELRTAMLWIWCFCFCMWGIAASIKYNVDWAPLACGCFGFVSLFEAIRWFVRSSRLDENEAEEEEEFEEEAGPDNSQPVEQSSQQLPPPQTYRLTPEGLKERANFYAFVHGICKQGIAGEKKWAECGLPAATYKDWMERLKNAGVLQPYSAGQTPKPRLTFEDALIAIANYGEEPDYWKPVINRYNPTKSENTLLIFDETR